MARDLFYNKTKALPRVARDLVYNKTKALPRMARA